MNDVVNANCGKFRLGEAQHLLPPLVKGDDAQVQLVLRLEHHLGGKKAVSEDFRRNVNEAGAEVTWWEKKEEFTSFWGISSRLGGPKGVQMQKRARGGSSVFRF